MLDYGEVVVHVMTEKSREFYGLDGRYGAEGGGELVDLVGEGLVEELGVASGGEGEMETDEQQDDDFWG